MKTPVKHSVKTTTKPPATSDKAESHYSLLGVENGESVKGRALRMNPDEATRILDHIKNKYARLTIHPKHVLVVRLPDEHKNAVILACQDGTPRLTRTSDCFQAPSPLLSTKQRETAKAKAKAERAAKEQSRKVPTKVSIKTTLDGKKATPSMLQKAMDEVKARAAKGSSSAKVTVVRATAKKAAKATPATAPVASPAPATVAAAPSTPAQS